MYYFRCMTELPVTSKIKKPDWLRVKLPIGEEYKLVRGLVDTHKLHIDFSCFYNLYLKRKNKAGIAFSTFRSYTQQLYFQPPILNFYYHNHYKVVCLGFSIDPSEFLIFCFTGKVWFVKRLFPAWQSFFQ